MGVAFAGAAAAGASALAGCASDSSGSTASDYTWDNSADVVVIGAGTGVGAALAAREAGASVILLEKTAIIGGNWTINGGVFYAPATDAMKANGIVDPRTGKDDTIEGAIADWMATTKGVGNAKLIQVIHENMQKFINGLVAEGVKFSGFYASGAGPVERAHLIEGKATGGTYMEILRNRLDASGATVMTETRARHILRDNLGNVIGVQATDSTGKAIYIGAKAVVVATGGYMAGEEMKARYNPETSGWGIVSGKHATGDGINMLLEQDAATCSGAVIVAQAAVEKNTNSILSIYDIAHYWLRPTSLIFVNDTGARFTDETLGYIAGDPLLLTNPTYGIFDQAEIDEEDFTVGTSWTHGDVQKAVDDGWIVKADTVAELAGLLYLDPAVLEKSVNDFNAGVAAGQDPFGRDPKKSRALVAPFYAYTGLKALGKCSLCVYIDDETRVVEQGAGAIPGLYAASYDLCFANWQGQFYTAGGSGCAGGYAISVYAGEQAAAYAKTA